jgi:hypothetical protein
MPGEAYQKPIGYGEMPEEITDVTIGIVYKEGKQAFGKGKRRTSNPYVQRSRALAAIWWNGWDTAQEEMEKRKPADQAARGLQKK